MNNLVNINNELINQNLNALNSLNVLKNVFVDSNISLNTKAVFAYLFFKGVE